MWGDVKEMSELLLLLLVVIKNSSSSSSINLSYVYSHKDLRKVSKVGSNNPGSFLYNQHCPNFLFWLLVLQNNFFLHEKINYLDFNKLRSLPYFISK